MSTFEYVSNTPQVTFRSGTLAQLPSIVQKLGVRSVMVLSTPKQGELAKRVAEILESFEVATLNGAVMHTPKHLTETALAQANNAQVNGIISVGGGSTIGLGKAISVRTGPTDICIPTTYAGSELTPTLGETEDGRKITRRDCKVLPTAVICDVGLTMALPVKLSVNSGINAIAHAVEALYAKNTNLIVDLMALQSGHDSVSS